MFKLTSFFICSIFVAYSEGLYVDTLTKCELKDQECLRKLYESVGNEIGNDGIPELSIPPLEPIVLKNVKVSILGLLDITLKTGTATGASRCTFKTFKIDLEKGTGSQENICSITIEGEYVLSSNNFLLNSFLGENIIRGEGHGKAIIDNVLLKLMFPARVEKHDDNETYIKVDYDKIDYDYKIKGGVKLAADNIYLGEQETSATIVAFLNHNWKFIMSKFGRPFIAKATEIYFDYAGKFFNFVPTKHYIKDDLSSLVKS